MSARRATLTALAGLATAALTACNQTGGPAASPSGTTTTAMQMPGGSGCSGQIGRFRAVIDNENRVGHVSPSVYTKVDADVTRAEAACAAGQDAEALRMLSATKARYGYPA